MVHKAKLLSCLRPEPGEVFFLHRVKLECGITSCAYSAAVNKLCG